MTTIGQLSEIKHGTRLGFAGQIRTLQMSIRFQMLENQSRNSAEAPDYVIVAKNRDGSDVKIGAAWKKQSKAQATAGEEFLSITIDDPSLEKPLNVAAFRKTEGNWDITWRRRQIQIAVNR
jgi:uncharacterized protein (DUF736 family)